MSTTIKTPDSVGGWLIVLWGVGGVALILLQAIVRLSPMALSLLEVSLTTLQWVLCGLWIAFMVYSEAWRGFHKQFSPRVVVRGLRLAQEPSPGLVLLAPLVCMGLLHGTRKRLIVSRSLVVGIVVLVLIVRQLPVPWRGIIDAGVVIGLAGGLLSLLWFAVRAAMGTIPPNPADFPGDAPTAPSRSGH